MSTSHEAANVCVKWILSVNSRVLLSIGFVCTENREVRSNRQTYEEKGRTYPTRACLCILFIIKELRPDTVGLGPLAYYRRQATEDMGLAKLVVYPPVYSKISR